MPPTEPSQAQAALVLGKRVLIVDDNKDAATSLAMLLDMSGAATELAYDGPSALDAAARFRPDVVLMDIGLPGLNGYEVARRMRGEAWGKEATLVAITGWGQLEDRQRSKDAGFDAHLVKPVDYAALMRLLATTFGPTS